MMTEKKRMSYNFIRENQGKRKLKRLLSILMACVVFVTTYALILPALTAEAKAYCGITEHQHTEGCYTDVLICGLEEAADGAADGTEAHVHTDACYEKQLTCGKEVHSHDLACYSDPEADVETAKDWEKSLPKEKELTGRPTENLVLVAKSQEQYQESVKNYQVAEDGKTISGYTRYGAWDGQPYAPWGLAFAAFCLHYAGITDAYLPVDTQKEEAWIALLEKENLLYPADSEDAYQAGDLVFLEAGEDGPLSVPHAGIIIRADDKEITLIEGDREDAVEQVTYRRDSDKIMAVCRMELVEARMEANGSEESAAFEEAARPEAATAAKETGAQEETVVIEDPATPAGKSSSIEKNLLAGDGHNYKVTVSYDQKAGIPEGAELEVEEILSGASQYEDYLTKTEDALGLDAGSVSYVRIFDISIVKDGEKIQPADGKTVDVKIELADAESDDLMVVHFADGSKDGDVVNSQVSASPVQDDGMTVSFEATGFSAYAIVQGPSAIPLGWTKITTLDKLKELASDGLYIGTTGGYYMTNTTAVGSQDAATTGIVKTKPAQSYPTTAAVKYYFEAVSGEDNQFYAYCLDQDGSRLYVNNTGDQNLYLTSNESEKTAFTVLVDNGRFRFQNVDRYWNMWNGANGNHIAAWTSQTDGNNYFYIWDYIEAVSDPYGLEGKNYGLMYWVDGTNGKALMSSANETAGHLDALSLTVMSKANNSARLYVPDNSDISFWTFHHAENDYYYLTAVVDGSTKYLKITASGLSMESTPDENCKIQVIPGEGTHAGQISLKAGGKTLSYSGKLDSGFQIGGAAGLEWLNLVEESELDNTYFMTYSAGKVSVSDKSVTNGSRVIVYTRVWNDTTKKYEFYAIDHDGSLVRCYESGDDIEWVGGRLNSMLWNFVEYYWEGTTDPNGYYELYNQYSEKYIAPQKSSEQVLSDDTIGINMQGRQNGKYYSPIVAWDDGYYAYAGLKADMETGKVISCPLAEADDFYFAIVKDMPADDELHTVATVDHKQYGITMKMVNFGTDQYGNGNDKNVRWKMGEFLGSMDKNGSNSYDYYKNKGKVEPGLLETALGENGYPVTKAGNSLSTWFADAQEVNHLFIASTYQGTGYYEYDSTQNFAHLDKDNNFTVYKELAACAESGQFYDHGHFWPYNDIEAGKYATNKNLRDALGNLLPDSDPRKYEKLYAVQKSNTSYAPDYYLGVELSATFTQTPNGHDDWGHDIIYEFTGDDDFWLFVDGELIIDLGGIHDALPGSVNYRTGEVVVNGTHTTLRKLFEENYRGRNSGATDEEVGAYLDGIFDGEIFKAYSTHTMKIYYLERGAGASNLHMRFNLASIKPGTAQLTKHLSGVDTTETILAEFPYQIKYKIKDNAGNVTEHYLTNAAQDSSRTKDYVFYKDSTTPVTYQKEYTVGGKTYNDVFLLKPEETADISFPIESFEDGSELEGYQIIECGVNTDVYKEVKINGTTVAGTPAAGSGGDGTTVTGTEADDTEVTDDVDAEADDAAVTNDVDDEENINSGRLDYATGYATTEERSRVVYDNVVNPDALTSLTITKKLYDVTGKDQITEDEDKTVFNFRLYLATESGDIDSSPASMHTYHVKDSQGNYCKWDVAQKRIVSLGNGRDSFTGLNEEEREAATFHTSLNGSISNIPVGYTIEVRDVLIGTKFKLVERPSEVPDGYSFKKYVYGGTDHTDAWAGVSDTISSSAGAHVEVDNAKGFGLRVNKTWVDKDYMSARDPVYFGIFYQKPVGTELEGTASEGAWELVPGSLTRLPYGESTVYWYYDQLPVTGVTDFSKYVIYEVSLTNPVVDADNKVTSHEGLTILDGVNQKQVQLNGKQTGDTDPSLFTYTVSYSRGELSANNNVRVDEVTNSRPGIILKKTKWNGTTPLAGAKFTLKDGDGQTIGTYTSAEDGLITEAFLRKNVDYTLTETAAPRGWHGLENALTIKLDENGVVSVTGGISDTGGVSDTGDISVIGVDEDESYYTVTPGTDTEKTTITVKNRPYVFQAVKTDSDTEDPLANVSFKLYRQITVDNVQSWDPNPYPGYESLKSDQNGLIFSTESGALPAGTYQLREVEPLNGYGALSGHITFTVSSTGKVELTGNIPAEATLDQKVQRDGSILYTLNVVNSKFAKVSVWKTDAGYNTLTGAEFSLYKAEGYDDDTGSPKDGATAILSGAVGSNGILSLGTLASGEYRLVETKAPANYIALDSAVKIKVSNGTVTASQGTAPSVISTNNNGDAKYLVPGQDNGTWQIRVWNSTGYQLPAAGGPGTHRLYLIGAILALGAGILLVSRRLMRQPFFKG